MPERKVWSEREDSVLRLLREERKERKWAAIARTMEREFGIVGRTGKQCRQRYHNHLHASIVTAEWTPQEEQILFKEHAKVGNKWSAIAQALPGRSDNCVKNHFYSKLRKSLRRLNKIIQDVLKKHLPIRGAVLSRIMKTAESKFKNESKVDEELAEFCDSIKNRLFGYEFTEEDYGDLDFAEKIITDIETFDRDLRKEYKGNKNLVQYEYKTYLKPPPKTLKKNPSTRSCSSAKSEDSSSSFLSNSSNSSSFFGDISESQADIEAEENPLKKTQGSESYGTKSGNSSRRNSESLPKSKQESNSAQEAELYEKGFSLNEHILKPSRFELQHEVLIMEESEFYDRGNSMREIGFEMNMNYEESPQLGSILAPKETIVPFFLLEKQDQDNEDIQYEAELEKMDLQ